MFYWKPKFCVILLLVFSGFNLIRSDCGADGSFCINRYDRRADTSNYEKIADNRRELHRDHRNLNRLERREDVRAIRIDQSNRAIERSIQRDIDQARLRINVRSAEAERRRVESTSRDQQLNRREENRERQNGERNERLVGRREDSQIVSRRIEADANRVARNGRNSRHEELNARREEHDAYRVESKALREEDSARRIERNTRREEDSDRRIERNTRQGGDSARRVDQNTRREADSARHVERNSRHQSDNFRRVQQSRFAERRDNRNSRNDEHRDARDSRLENRSNAPESRADQYSRNERRNERENNLNRRERESKRDERSARLELERETRTMDRQNERENALPNMNRRELVNEKRVIRMDSQQHQQRTTERRVLDNSRDQYKTSDQYEREGKHPSFTLTGVSLKVLQIIIVAALMAHVMRKDDLAKPGKLTGYIKNLFASPQAKTTKAF